MVVSHVVYFFNFCYPQKRLHEKIYGKTMLSSSLSSEATLSNTIIENPAMLKLQQQHKEQQKEQASKIKQFTTPKKDAPVPVVEAQPVVSSLAYRRRGVCDPGATLGGTEIDLIDMKNNKLTIWHICHQRSERSSNYFMKCV